MTIQTGQTKIAVTGTAVRLGTGSITSGLIVTNNSTTNAVTLGYSTVNNTVDGTGNGYVLRAGASVSMSYENFAISNGIYVNGTENDWVSWIGS